MSTIRSDITQRLVNTFLETYDVRKDEQSLGYQLLNAFGRDQEALIRQVIFSTRNYWLGTANSFEPDLFYKFRLPDTFNFVLSNGDPLNPSYTEPTVTGWVGTTTYPVTTPEENTLESFLRALPNRITTDKTDSTSHVLLSETDISTFPYISTLTPFQPGRVWFHITEGSPWATDDKLPYLLLTGTTRKGQEETEIVYFLFDGWRQTSKEWKEITRIDAMYISDSAKIVIQSARFGDGPYLDALNQHYSLSRNKTDLFWDLGESILDAESNS